jgi:hypothetical protein
VRYSTPDPHAAAAVPYDPRTDPSGLYLFLNLKRAAQARGLQNPTRAAGKDWADRIGQPCPFLPLPINPATGRPYRPEDF